MTSTFVGTILKECISRVLALLNQMLKIS